MSELLNNISNSNLVTLTILMSVVALILAIAISIEIYKNARNDRNKVVKVTTDLNGINIQQVDGIKYVDEDSELEKTKARMELAELKERLRKEELEKNKLLEMNMALANRNVEKKEEVKEIIKENITEKVIEKEVPVIINQTVVETPILDKIKENIVKEKETIIPDENVNNINININEVKEEASEEIEVLEQTMFKTPVEIKVEKEEIDPFISEDEESAIISFEELEKTPNTALSEDGIVNYEDEKTAVISILELQKLYEESQNITTKNPKEVELLNFDVKKMEDLPKIKDFSNFQSSPFISPIHGLTQTENDIILTSTANLERLNKEIKKTNEFLQALKVLKKNLE